MKLRIQSRDVEHLRSEAERVQPVEACALLFGRLSRRECVVEKVVDAENRLHSSARFEIAPEAAVAAIIAAEKEGWEFVGFFHSHPAPAAPSTVDVEFMRLWGTAVWLILSLTDGTLAAYQLLRGKLRALEVDVE